MDSFTSSTFNLLQYILISKHFKIIFRKISQDFTKFRNFNQGTGSQTDQDGQTDQGDQTDQNDQIDN
ncbi:hypothetical protein C2G38_2215827 [Gigaspora rosea]|uniref:Uncharacterized protein n=1 Tax=Gigaspora rosea TaxID=44941 RepID=A0A397UBC7_9GLOM|nr:hypothetical protein C2G38_2215827 [Gigaspora rosea]